MTIASQNWQIIVVVHSVHSMSNDMELSAICITVIIRKLETQRLVHSTKENGINMFRIILSKALMVLEECYKDLQKICLGIQHLEVIHSLMMSLLQSQKEVIILLLLELTALKQYVLHVVL